MVVIGMLLYNLSDGVFSVGHGRGLSISAKLIFDLVVSCIDVRVLREAFFGLKYGGLFNLFFLPLQNIVISIIGVRIPADTATEAAVVSNAGGRITADALQNIMVLDSFVGVGTVIVVHHTGEFNPILPSSWTESKSCTNADWGCASVNKRLRHVTHHRRNAQAEAQRANWSRARERSGCDGI